jgi:putative ABC transport system permease protein
MIRHTLLILYRNLKRDISTFSINLFGLTAGLTCALLIFLWVNDEWAKNKFHENDARLFQVMEHQRYSDQILTTESTPGPLAEDLQREFPEIEMAVCTMWMNSYDLTVGDKTIKGRGFPVGRDYFQMFSYPIVQGNAATLLADESSIVISEELAKKFFTNVDEAIGKQIILDHDVSYLVSGVFTKVPSSSYQFDFVTSFGAVQKKQEWLNSYDSNGPPTYVLLREGSNAAHVSEKIKDFVKSRKKDSQVELFLRKYSDQYLHDKWENGKLVGGRIEYVRLFSLVAVAILLIACINFMNLSTAQAARRAKEVGVKKSVGAERNSLIAQFLTESLVVAMLAFLISLVVVWLFLPIFNSITEKEMVLPITHPAILIGLLGISILTGLFAGSYPALFLSGFKPVEILKNQQLGSFKEVLIRKGLVVFQFAIAVILIVSILVINNQIRFVQSRSLGYDRENLVRIPFSNKLWQLQETFINELKKLPGVVNASSIGHSVAGRNNNTSSVEWPGKRPDDRILFETMYGNFETVEVLGFSLLEGRNFSRDYASDSAAIIFNEAAIEMMGLTNPIGQEVKANGYNHHIVGVVKNFNFQSLHSPVEPAYIILSPRTTWNVLVRLAPGNLPATIKEIETVYKRILPEYTFNYVFQDDAYARMYSAEQRVATLAGYFALFAVIISCLGLYGLATHMAERRLKEMGIRKALGLSAQGILFLLSRDFTKQVLVGIAIGLPVSYWWLNQWLQRFAFRIELNWWYFLTAAAIALCIAWVTVASKVWRAAQVNPVDCIRLER